VIPVFHPRIARANQPRKRASQPLKFKPHPTPQSAYDCLGLDRPRPIMDISCGAEVSEAARLRSLHEPATSLPLNFSLPVPDDWDNFNSVWCWEELPSLFELDDPIESLQNHQFPSPASSVESNNPPAFYFDGCCIDPRLLVLGNPNGGPDPGEFSNFPQTPVLTPASTPALSYGTPTPVSSPASIYGASTPQASGREALLVDPIGSSPSLCRYVFHAHNFASHPDLKN
jgi:hypothetical protein